MAKSRILIQLDCDQQPSTFDAVVAIDAGVDHLLRQAGVNCDNVENLIHGAMFTRGGDDLKSTAIFVGGSDVSAAEAICDKIEQVFFGSVRVSLMADPNGANTTAAAAVLSAEQHLNWNDKTITILGGTGPVGQRIATILGRQVKVLPGNARVRVASRSLDKARETCLRLEKLSGTNCFDPVRVVDPESGLAAIEGAHAVFAAGAAGVGLLDDRWLGRFSALALAIDLNAVPPVGISGIDVFDKGTLRGSTICYGAIGVGGLKMKIHKHCIQTLFQSNDRKLLVDQIFEVGRQLKS
jgi:hypothetical protein